MGFMATIDAAPAPALFVIRALRCYAGTLDRRAPVLPPLADLAGRHGLPAPAGIALASVFELTEACLGRRLVPAPPGALVPSADEDAVLLMLTATDLRPHLGTTVVPHGLPGALLWAIRSAHRLCGGIEAPSVPPPACPFRPDPLAPGE